MTLFGVSLWDYLQFLLLACCLGYITGWLEKKRDEAGGK